MKNSTTESQNIKGSIEQNTSAMDSGTDSDEIVLTKNDNIPILPLWEKENQSDNSWESLFTFYSEHLPFDVICKEIIKDTRRMDIYDDQWPSFEEQIKDISLLQKIDIWKECVDMLKQPRYKTKGCILSQIDP